MKRQTFITMLFVFITHYLFAQWTPNGTSIYNTNSGNVGIGTTTPAAILSVKGSALPTPQWSGYTSSMQVGELIIQDYNVIPQVGIMQNVYWDGGANKYILSGYASQMYMGANGSIAFYVYNSGTSGSPVSGTGVAMTLANNGNLGIGIANPLNKLDVNGTIHSKSVLIDMNGWSDYVFKPAYRLRPLTEVKAYIDQHQHLPEMPSEQEITKNGLNLGEMNKLLMKKVEELTLYLIEKDNMEKEQKKINQNYAIQMEKLTEQVKSLANEFNNFKSQVANK